MTKTSRAITIAILSLICLAPTLASAKSKRYILNYGDSTFSSRSHQPATLFLKRELSRQHPGLNVSECRLEKVVIMAKSKKGKGSARLRVNDRYSSPVRIAGSPHVFYSSDRFNYDKKTLYNPAGSNGGPWQLELKGNIKLRKLVLVIDSRKQKNHHYGYTHPRKPFYPVVLPARIWGTHLEGERHCGQGSANARDGWDFPDSVCRSGAKAVFRGGYRPTRLYIRPDISPLWRLNRHQPVRQLYVTVTLAEGNQNQRHSTSATIGVDIGDRTFTKQIVLKNKGFNKRSATESLTISGRWDHADIANSRIWILPGKQGSDMTVKQLQIRVKKVG